MKTSISMKSTLLSGAIISTLSFQNCAGSAFSPIDNAAPSTTSTGTPTIDPTATPGPQPTSTPTSTDVLAITMMTMPPTDAINGSIGYKIDSINGVKNVSCSIDAGINNPLEKTTGVQMMNPCPTTIQYSGLRATPHTLTITAVDNQGNTQVLNYSWTIALDPAVQLSAVTQTIAQNANCNSNAALGSYYWEIGTANGKLAGGSVQGAAVGASPTPAPVLETTNMDFASASKMLFGTYAMQSLYPAGNSSQVDANTKLFLHMESPYTYLQDASCGGGNSSLTQSSATTTVLNCYNICCIMDASGNIVSAPVGSTGSAAGNLCGPKASVTSYLAQMTGSQNYAVTCNSDIRTSQVQSPNFYYDGGHFQRFAVAASAGVSNQGDGLGTYGLDLANKTGTLSQFGDAINNLAPFMLSSLGLSAGSNLQFAFPQLAGGWYGSAQGYASVLQQILGASGKNLSIYSFLGQDPVCAWEQGLTSAVCSDGKYANYSPIEAQAFHYSYGHWVEDDPNEGDGSFSSPGKFGFYPWIDASKTYYGVISRHDGNGPQLTGAGSIVGAGYASLLCGAHIREAYLTGVVQTQVYK